MEDKEPCPSLICRILLGIRYPSLEMGGLLFLVEGGHLSY